MEKREIKITNSNVNKYIELYNASSYMTKKNFKRFKQVIAAVTVFLTVVCAGSMIITQFPNINLILSFITLDLACTVVYLNKIVDEQIDIVYEKYPELEQDVSFSEIKEKVEEFQKNNEHTTEEINEEIIVEVSDIALEFTNQYIEDEITEINNNNNEEFDKKQDIVVSKKDSIEELQRKRELIETMIEVKVYSEESNGRKLTYERSENYEKE